MRKDIASMLLASTEINSSPQGKILQSHGSSFPTTQAFTNLCKFFRFQKNQLCICSYKTQEHSSIEHGCHIGEKRQYIRRYLGKKR